MRCTRLKGRVIEWVIRPDDVIFVLHKAPDLSHEGGKLRTLAHGRKGVA